MNGNSKSNGKVIPTDADVTIQTIKNGIEDSNYTTVTKSTETGEEPVKKNFLSRLCKKDDKNEDDITEEKKLEKPKLKPFEIVGIILLTLIL